MFTLKQTHFYDALLARTPVYFRQIGGVTWMKIRENVASLAGHPNFEIFEYWLGDDYPKLPGSADPNYPAEMRPKLLAVLNAARRDEPGYSIHRSSCPYEHGGNCTCR